MLPQPRHSAKNGISLHTLIHGKSGKKVQQRAETQFLYFEKPRKLVGRLSDSDYHAVFHPPDGGTDQNHKHRQFLPAPHIGAQFFHKPAACFDDILKFINHNNFFPVIRVRNHGEYFRKRRIPCFIICCRIQFPSPLETLFPLGSGTSPVVITGLVFCKTGKQSGFPHVFFSVEYHNLTACPLIICI